MKSDLAPSFWVRLNSKKSIKGTVGYLYNENSPQSTLACLLRTRTHKGVCSSVASVKSGGSLNSNTCYTGWRLCLKNFMPSYEGHYAETVYKKRSHLHMFLCTKYSCVQSFMYKPYLCEQKYFTLYFKNLSFFAWIP